MATRTAYRALTLAAAVLATAACSMQPVTVSPSEPHGIVVQATPQTANGIYPVVIREIDGRRVQGQQNAYWLAPGEHELRVFPQIDRTATRAQPSTFDRRDEHERNVLRLTVEEGKRYLIAARIEGARTDGWEAFVLGVQDID